MSKILVRVWWSKWFIVRKSSLCFDRENKGSERDWKKKKTLFVRQRRFDFDSKKECGPKWRGQLVVWTNTLHILVRGNVEQWVHLNRWSSSLPLNFQLCWVNQVELHGILNHSPFALSLHRQGWITQGVRSQTLKVWKCEFLSCPDFALIWISVQKTVYLVDLPNSYPYSFVHMTVLAVFHHSLL